MINIYRAECTGRPGIVRGITPDGTYKPLATRDREGKLPYVCKCECEGREILNSVMKQLILKAILSGEGPDSLPNQAEDFTYEYVDEEPEGLDVEVSSTAEASDILKSISKKAKG